MNLIAHLENWDHITPFQDIHDIERGMDMISTNLGSSAASTLLEQLILIETEHPDLLDVYYEFMVVYYRQYKTALKTAIDKHIKQYLQHVAFMDLLNDLPEGHLLIDLVDLPFYKQQSTDWRIAFAGALGALRDEKYIPFLDKCLQEEQDDAVRKEIQIAIQHSSLHKFISKAPFTMSDILDEVQPQKPKASTKKYKVTPFFVIGVIVIIVCTIAVLFALFATLAGDKGKGTITVLLLGSIVLGFTLLVLFLEQAIVTEENKRNVSFVEGIIIFFILISLG